MHTTKAVSVYLGPDIDSVPRCDELLNFAFTDGSFDSKSCNNFAAGELHKDPIVADDVLCLNGTGQFLAVSFKLINSAIIVIH